MIQFDNIVVCGEWVAAVDCFFAFERKSESLEWFRMGCPCYFIRYESAPKMGWRGSHHSICRPKDHHWVMFDGPVDALWIESWEALRISLMNMSRNLDNFYHH